MDHVPIYDQINDLKLEADSNIETLWADLPRYCQVINKRFQEQTDRTEVKEEFFAPQNWFLDMFA